jgi:hypothetical protein
MTAREQRPGVVDLRTRRGYRPDVVSLACSKVAAARERTGVSVAAFAGALEQLLGWPPTPELVKAWESTVAPPGQVVIACEVIASRMAQAEPRDDDEVASAAREAEAEQSRMLTEPGPQSIDSLREETLEIARAANRSALDLFSASRRIRCHALKLAEQTYRPRALSDLYVIAGQATALMASTAFDLDRWDESATLARSAVSRAALVGNASLQAWTLGLAALLANWRNEPDTALSHFSQGLQVAPRGTPRARLRYIAARSYALLGDTSSVARVVDQARRDQDDAEQHSDSLCEGTGGEFAFGRARAEACAAAAWLDLGRGHEAKEAARRALSDLTTLPSGRQPVSQVTGARIDLATACLMQHELDEAEGRPRLRLRYPVVAQERLALGKASPDPEEPGLPLLVRRSGSTTPQ